LSDALERRRLERATEVKLESGLLVTLRLPWIQECITAVGDVPMPVLAEISSAAEQSATPNLGASQMATVLAYNQALVRSALVAIEGEPVTLPADEPVSVYLEEDDAMEIVAYASRQKPLPGKG
jgi:hypothetical protein